MPKLGQRGFLLTGNDRYLEPYRHAVTEIPANLDALARTEAGRDPREIQRIDRLKPLVRDKMDELAETIELRRNQGLDPALAIVRSDRGQSAMDQIRAICAEIQTASYDLLAKQRRGGAHQRLSSGVYRHGGERGRLRAPVSCHHHHPQGNPPTSTADRRSSARARSKPHAARDLLQTTISSIGDGVITTGATGKVIFLNPDRPIVDRMDAGTGGGQTPGTDFQYQRRRNRRGCR